jgi:hypothetical protein
MVDRTLCHPNHLDHRHRRPIARAFNQLTRRSGGGVNIDNGQPIADQATLREAQLAQAICRRSLP